VYIGVQINTDKCLKVVKDDKLSIILNALIAETIYIIKIIKWKISTNTQTFLLQI